ncbi:hypothetical protein [Mucilaginibacter polytrichastri]|uniref:Uncharacterized protein n=1 Tax=Mucilaginibacter polytrichastri TaxID=1302689 RepID=A0A1Q6A511_9SPHI|nr:hypothetical protein [Mucilaginibacter polytrichastri]OKS89101.1 hypothetical protein RG47T_4582 [Mucilaginibacter polytrichastri]SFS96533.1 hypothetical protein SAMN04487890_107143 [Mucilaginibacter polytrichastri]
MDKLTFTIFEPDNKRFRWTPDWIIVLLYGSLLIMFWVLDGMPADSALTTLKNLYLVSVVILSIYFIISSFWTYEPLKGKINGEVEFSKDYIKIKNELYNLNEISNVEFHFNKFHGESLVRLYNSVNGILSQGVNNSVLFTDNENQTHQVYFRLDAKNEYLSLSPFINQAVSLKRMRFKDAIDSIGIENVSVTQ